MIPFKRFPAWREALGLLAVGLLAAWPAGATEQAASAPRAVEPAAGPEEALKPFLGTWLLEEDITHGSSADSFKIQRYILIRWHREHLQVKTFNFFTRYKARDMESNWKGSITIDRWNQAKQTFTLMPDGTISVGLSGTNGIAQHASKTAWWAAGNMQVLPDDEHGPRLRFHTFRGFAPSSTGNAWKPFDRIYDLVSREIDPKYARPAGH